MTETWQVERARLFMRTAELKARNRELAAPFRPFSPIEHDQLRGELHRHFVALAEFRERCVAQGRWQPQSPVVGLPRAAVAARRPVPHAS